MGVLVFSTNAYHRLLTLCEGTLFLCDRYIPILPLIGQHHLLPIAPPDILLLQIISVPFCPRFLHLFSDLPSWRFDLRFRCADRPVRPSFGRLPCACCALCPYILGRGSIVPAIICIRSLLCYEMISSSYPKFNAGELLLVSLLDQGVDVHTRWSSCWSISPASFRSRAISAILDRSSAADDKSSSFHIDSGGKYSSSREDFISWSWSCQNEVNSFSWGNIIKTVCDYEP